LQFGLENAYSCSNKWGPHRKSGPNFAKTGHYLLSAGTLTVLNFIAVCKTVYEKRVAFYNLQYFSARMEPPTAMFTNLSSDVQQPSSIKLPNFVPYENHSTIYRQPKFVYFVDGVTDKDANKQNKK